jgi:hypothetical protein
MTLYAASDRVAVSVSPDGEGGCGTTHRRPFTNGAPEKLWALDCPPCENHLRHDPGWSTTLSEIPETHDEKKSREDYEKRGAKDVNTMLALALARMTGGDIPDTVAGMISGAMPHLAGITTGKMVCPDGHENPPGKKFCGDCGAAMHKGAAAAALEPPPPPAAANGAPSGNGHTPGDWEPPRDGQGRKKPMRDWRLEDLQALAHQMGADPGGSRTDLIGRLRAAKKQTAAV